MVEYAEYIVAGYRFAVESIQPNLLCGMTNYEPFKVACIPMKHDSGNVIFTLQIGHTGLLSEIERSAYHLLFTDNTEQDMPRIEVYKLESCSASSQDKWLIRVALLAQSPICCEIVCDATFTNGKLYIVEDCRDIRFCIDNALMLMYAFRTASLMTLEMHAAVVVKKTSGGDLGYLFLGHSGTGKSTHARQWLAAFDDAWLLNDDNPIIRVMDDGQVMVFGSPWSGKTPCYINFAVRIGGIVKLSQAPHNKIRSLSLPEAYAYMLSSASGLKMNSEMADYMYQSIKHIITSIKMYHLDCLPNEDAAHICFDGINIG